MKRSNSLARLFLIACLAGFMTTSNVVARVTGTQPNTSTTPDAWCTGRNGAEVCVDRSGNLLSTTDNDATLGTDALDWANVYTEDLDVDDDASIGGALSVTEPITASAGMAVITSSAPRTAVGVAALYSAYTIPIGQPFYNTQSGVLCISSGTTQNSITVSTGTGACPQ